MHRIQGAYIRLLMPVIALLALAALAACGGSGGDGAGGGEDITLSGNWTGSWVQVLGDGDPGGITLANFIDSGDTTLSGSMDLHHEICGTDANSSAFVSPITGTLSGTSLTFDITSGGATVTFAAAFPNDPMTGLYQVASISGLCLSLAWNGTFTLTKQ